MSFKLQTVEPLVQVGRPCVHCYDQHSFLAEALAEGREFLTTEEALRAGGEGYTLAEAFVDWQDNEARMLRVFEAEASFDFLAEEGRLTIGNSGPTLAVVPADGSSDEASSGFTERRGKASLSVVGGQADEATVH